MENSRKLIRCAVFGQIPILVQILSGFVLMPKMILFFGDRYYGLWVLVGTLLGYFGLLDLGFSKTIIRYVSRALGKDNKEESDGWITVGLFLFLICSLIGFFLLFLGIWVCQFFVSEDLYLIRKVFFIGGSAFLLALPSRCAVGVLQAHVRGDILDGALSAIGILRIGALLTAIFFNASFINFVCILAFFTLLQAIVASILALHIHAGFKIQKNWISRHNLKIFADYSAFSFVAQLADLFRFQAYPVIISTFLGLSAITPFAIANQIRMILGRIHNKVLVNLTPVFSQIEGRFGIGEELKSAYFFSYKLSIYFVSFTVGLTAIVASDFINRWVGISYNDSLILLLVSLVGNMAAGIQIPAVCFLFGASKQKFYAISNTIESFLLVFSALILVNKFGLLGIVAGASMSTFVIKTFVQPMWVARSLKFSFIELHTKHTLPNMIKVVLFLLPMYFIAKIFLEPNYLIILLFCLFTTIFFIPYIMIIGFSQSENNRIINSMSIFSKIRSIIF